MRPSDLAFPFERMSRAAGTAQNTKGRMMELQYGTTRRQQLEELQRELKMREKVYPKWVTAGRLKKTEMDHRLNCFRAIIEDFEARHAPKSQQGSLGL